MAEDKRGALIYADQLKTVELLPDDVAGRLFKIILRYINDENPVIDELIVKVAFEPIKQQFRRDLKKWEGSKEVKSQSGAIGNLKRWHVDLYQKFINEKLSLIEALEIANNRKKSQPDKQRSQRVPKIAVTVDDTVTVTGTVINTNIKEGMCVESSELIKNLVADFGFTEMRFAQHQKTIYQFVVKLEFDGKVSHFINQYRKYKEYKKFSGEKKHSFRSFIGTASEKFENGAWDSENWEHKTELVRKDEKLNSTKGATDQSQNTSLFI